MEAIFAGVDLGGTNIHAALATEDGRIVSEAKEPTRSHEGPERVIARIDGMIQRLAGECGRLPEAVGVGVPGLAEIATGVVRFLPNLPTQWCGVPLGAALEAAVKRPVRVLNDARAAALGELAFGHGRTADSFIFFTLGTGIGGGVVLDKRLRLGPMGAAGELGHQTVVADGPLCGCGNRGCLETVASGPALAGEGVRLLLSGNAPRLRELCGGDLNRVTAAAMGEAAQAGDLAVGEAIRRAGNWIGVAAANVVCSLHPEMVVLGGGVAHLGALLTDPVERTIRSRVGMFPVDDVRVRVSQLGDRAGLLGAVALAAQRGLSLPSPAGSSFSSLS